MPKKYIKFDTDYLSANHTLSQNTEIYLPLEADLTQKAEKYLKEKNITVKYKDAEGKIYTKTAEGKKKHIHPLNAEDKAFAPAHCPLCQQTVPLKNNMMTHLNADVYVLKNDPRIFFRAALDACIAQILYTQIKTHSETSQAWLNDIRSALGNIMSAEVMQTELKDIEIAQLNIETIHQYSHNPLKYLGYDHIVPSIEHGEQVILLNLLRTKIRETELIACKLYINADFTVSRPDILQALNRLSSAVYVLMIMEILNHQ